MDIRSSWLLLQLQLVLSALCLLQLFDRETRSLQGRRTNNSKGAGSQRSSWLKHIAALYSDSANITLLLKSRSLNQLKECLCSTVEGYP